jgi:hypothetical protein
VCSAQSVFGEQLNDQGIQFVREVAESLGNLQEYLAGGARSQPLEDGQLVAIRDNIDLLTEKLQSPDVVRNLNNPDRSGRSLDSAHQLKKQLLAMTESLIN